MKASIVIPNYNGEIYLKSCINSLINQTFNDFEIIVVDNNSIDGSYEFIRDNYPQVRFIRLSENYGFSFAVNIGIKNSICDYVVLLNNDTEVEEDWLENLLICIKKSDKIFSCSSKMIRFNNRNLIDDAGDGYNCLGWAYKRGDGLGINYYIEDDKVFSSCAGAAIYNKRILDEIGYFDETFFAYMEDVDISYRAKVYGYCNIYCSDAIVYHIGSATSGSKYNNFKAKLAARNNLYIIFKNMPFFQLLLNSPFLLIGFITKIIFFYKIGFGQEYISGLKEGLSKLNKINRIKYRNKNLINYVTIQIELYINLFKYILTKFMRKCG